MPSLDPSTMDDDQTVQDPTMGDLDMEVVEEEEPFPFTLWTGDGPPPKRRGRPKKLSPTPKGIKSKLKQRFKVNCVNLQ